MPAITASALRLSPGLARTRIPTPTVMAPAAMASRQSESVSNRLLGGARAAIDTILSTDGRLRRHLDRVSLLEALDGRGSGLREHRAEHRARDHVTRVVHSGMHPRVPDEDCEHTQGRT